MAETLQLEGKEKNEERKPKKILSKKNVEKNRPNQNLKKNKLIEKYVSTPSALHVKKTFLLAR